MKGIISDYLPTTLMEKCMKRGAFVTIHGIDGTGKSETVKVLAQILASRGVKTIDYDAYKIGDVDNPFEPIKKWVEAKASVSAQFDFYVASMAYHSKVIARFLTEGRVVVRSRYIEDVIAQYMYLGVPYVRESVESAGLLQQDLQVVLILPEEIRRERIMQRGEVDVKDREMNTPGSRLDFFERMLLYTARCRFNTRRGLILDTSIFSIEAVTERIVACLLDRDLIA